MDRKLTFAREESLLSPAYMFQNMLSEEFSPDRCEPGLAVHRPLWITRRFGVTLTRLEVGYTLRLMPPWLIALLRLTAVAAHARAGGGHAFSSGGSFHSGGGSYGGSGFSSGGGGGGGGDAIGLLIELWIRFVILHPVLGVPLTLVVVYVVVQCYGVVDDARVSGTISRGLEQQDTLSLNNNLTALRQRDPKFDTEAFLRRVESAFLAVQAAWSAMDMAPARAWISDGVMERFAVQLAMMRGDRARNDMQDVKVLEAEILQVESSAFWDVIHVRVQASAVDRDVSLDDGSVLRGGDAPESFEEVWTFARRPSARTLAGRGALEGACPNCGTALKLLDGEQCAACKSWLNSGEFDWVLCEITQASEWGARQPREVPGLAELAARDAALNSRFLEDRASVAFWRWHEALWSGQAQALRAVASDAFCEKLEGGGSYYREAAVGAVVALAVESGGDEDRVHLVVRWSGERCRRGEPLQGAKNYAETVLVLARKAGALTDARSGLRSLRCASCGAPPTSREASACDYCGHKFNDGSRHWVLVELMPASAWRRPEVRVPAAAGAQGAPVAAAAAASAVGEDYGWTASISADAALRVMAAAMACDGEIDPAERTYLETFARRRGIPEPAIAQLVDAARAGRIDVPKPENSAQACAFLRGVVVMSLADGKITRDERRAIDACAQALSLKPAEVDDLIARERDRLYRNAKEALKKA